MRRLLLIGTASILAITSLCINSTVFAQAGIWQTFNRANSQIKADSVIAIGFDAIDGVWSATRYGVQSLINNQWTDYTDLKKITSKDVWDIENTNGTIYFGTRSTLTAFDGTTWTTYTTDNSGLVNAPVLRLADDGMGYLWIGTARGLCRLGSDHLISSFKHDVVPIIPYNGIQDIAAGLSGDVWLIFIGPRGFVKLPGGSGALAKFIRQDTIPNMPSEAINCIAVDHSGNVWAGMRSTGVVRINASGAQVFNAGNTPAIHSNIINKIEVDACGNVWVASQHGTAMYDGSLWTAIPTDAAHIPNDTMLSLAVDSRGHIWFGSYGGLTVFKPLPQIPALYFPLMNMTMNSDTVTCKWNWDCPGITKYWYELADNPQFTNSKIDTTSASLMQSANKEEVNLKNNTTYYWRIKAQNDAGWGPFSNTWIFYVSFTSGVSMGEMMTSRCMLAQNYPNPCFDKTTFSFTMTKHENISLALYDILGRECATPLQGAMGPGTITIPFDASSLPHAGMFIYRLKAGDEYLQQTMHVMR